MSFTRGNAYQRAFRPRTNRNAGFDVSGFPLDANVRYWLKAAIDGAPTFEMSADDGTQSRFKGSLR